MKINKALMLFVIFYSFCDLYSITKEQIIEVYKSYFVEVSRIYKEISGLRPTGIEETEVKISTKLADSVQRAIRPELTPLINIDQASDFIMLLLQFCPTQKYQVSDENIGFFYQSIEALTDVFYYSQELRADPFQVSLNFVQAVKELFLIQQYAKDYYCERDCDLSSSIERLLCEKSKKSIVCSIHRLVGLIRNLARESIKNRSFEDSTHQMTRILRKSLIDVYKVETDQEILRQIQRTCTTLECWPPAETESIVRTLFSACPA